MTLDPIQLRVLGSLIEKEIATPENYPLSINALVNACNQKSSRDPVMALTEDEVRQALHTLEDLALVAPVHDGRVPKYEHRIRTVLNLRRDETAALCLLMLRGPQTPGEIRSRADRLYTFDDLGAVQATLDRLAVRNSGEEDPAKTGPLTVQLPRQPGSRESRYAHLLGAVPELTQSQPARASAFSVSPIGQVESPLKECSEAPRQGSEGAPEAWVVVNRDAVQGLSGIKAGDGLVLLTWLHQAKRDVLEAKRDVLEVRPGWDSDAPLTGVFATRSPDRPNPIGLHRVEVLEAAQGRLRVAPLEAIDGTPVVDIKPVRKQLEDA